MLVAKAKWSDSGKQSFKVNSCIGIVICVATLMTAPLFSITISCLGMNGKQKVPRAVTVIKTTIIVECVGAVG